MTRRGHRILRRKKDCGRGGVKIFTCLMGVLCLWYFFAADILITHVSLYKPDPQVQKLIEEDSARFHISPELLQAVILTESKYNPQAVSRTGAVGVMQIMPDTAQWIAEQSGLPADNLHDPKQNIALGAWYLYYLLDKYHGNLVLALAAYNAGRGNVDSWMKENRWPPDFVDINRIPFPETREFVKHVIQCTEELKAENSQTK